MFNYLRHMRPLYVRCTCEIRVVLGVAACFPRASGERVLSQVCSLYPSALSRLHQRDRSWFSLVPGPANPNFAANDQGNTAAVQRRMWSSCRG